MSKGYDKGFNDGIASQAKADAAFKEKEIRADEERAKEQQAHNDMTDEAIGIFADYVEADEGFKNFGLNNAFNIANFEINEKRFLINILHTLSTENNSEEQKKYFNCIVKYLGLTENPKTANLKDINNIDSTEQKEAIWYCICEYLFLKDCSELSNEKYKDIFGYYDRNEKYLQEIFDEIKNLYKKYGADFFSSKYSASSQVEEYITDPEPVIEKDSTEKLAEEPDTVKNNLKLIIQKYIDDIGKDVSDIPDISSEIKKIPRKIKSNISKKDLPEESELERIAKVINKEKLSIVPDSVVSIRKVSGGYFIFTTYAFYFPESKKYKEIAYENIIINELDTGKGKRKNESELSISYWDANHKKHVAKIDNSKVEEEALQELLKELHESESAKTDKAISFDKLSDKALIVFVAIMVYILKTSKCSLMEAYVLALDLKVDDYWDTICMLINNEKEFIEHVDYFKSLIPYPSEKSISVVACELVLKSIAFTQWAEGEENKGVASLNPKESELIKKLCFFEYTTEFFNSLRDESSIELRFMLGYISFDEYENNLERKANLLSQLGIGLGQYAVVYGILKKFLWGKAFAGFPFTLYLFAGMEVIKYLDGKKAKKDLIEDTLQKYIECRKLFKAKYMSSGILESFESVIKKLQDIQNKK